MSDPVLYESSGTAATITLNEPENHNTITPDLLASFAESVGRVRADRQLRVVIITGSGASFCAGADFSSVAAAAADDPLPHELALALYTPLLSVLEIAVPTIAALNGDAIGGGLGLALLCDIRVANR